MKISISNVKCGIVELYDAVAREIGYADTSELQYDCRKINVAENVQEGIIQYYYETARQISPMTSESDIRIGTAMALLQMGPKLDVALKANEVEVFDGFVIA